MSDYLFIGISFFLLLIGIIGCFVPVLPGPLFAYVGLLVFHFTSYEHYTREFLLIRGIISIGVVLLDIFLPIGGTKYYGGSKRGIWGSTIGTICGIIVFPLSGIVLGPFGIIGLIAGPFVGSFIAEFIHYRNIKKSWSSAVGSFIGFFVGVICKFIFTLWMGVYIFKGLLT